jgi:WXXGXW repeat (2 copies)
MKKLLNLSLITGLVATSAVGACYHQPASYAVARAATRPPPTARLEVVPASPGANYVWIAGRWGWSNNNFAWVPGSWVLPATGHSIWVPGLWESDGHGWFWSDGHWL